MFEAPNLPGWNDPPVQAMMEERLKLPVTLHNDANAAAYGEFWAGAGRDPEIRTLVLFTLAEALLTRTGWKLPQLALPHRAPREARVKIAKPKRAEKVVELQTIRPEKEVSVMLPPEESARSARFQRAKDKK